MLVLFVAAVIGLWTWAGTQDSLDWALRRVALSQPLHVEGVEGSLRSGLRIRKLRWEREGMKIEAEDVELAWQPLALLEGTVKLKRFHAASVRFIDLRPPSPEPFRLPESLVIRPRVELDELDIGKVEWITTRTMEVGALKGRYWFDGTKHWLKLESLAYAGGNYSGMASLGAVSPLPLDATVSGQLKAAVPGAATTLPLQFTAHLQGPLEDMQATAIVHSPIAGSAPPKATATAHITPWAAQPVPQAEAQLSDLDLAALWPDAPQTLLAGHVKIEPAGTRTWQVSADLRNERAGPWDKERLPIEQVKAKGQWRDGTVLVQELDARLGGGHVLASGQWESRASGWSVRGTVDKVNPAALHSQMAAVPLSGPVNLRQVRDAIAFDANLSATGRAPAVPAGGRAASSQLAATLRALELRLISAEGNWAGGNLSLPKLQVRTSDATLQGSVELQPREMSGRGQLELQAPGMRAAFNGDLAETRGGGTLQLDVANLALAQQWLQRVPALPAVLTGNPIDGRATLRLGWQGGWRDPVVQATLSSPALAFRGADAKAVSWTASELLATLNGRLSDATVAVRAKARQGQRQLSLDVAARGGRTPLQRGAAASLQGNVSHLSASLQDPATGPGAWQLALQRAFDVRWSPSGSGLEVAAGQAALTAPANQAAASSQALLAWDPIRWRAGELRSAGRLTGLPMGWIELAGGPQLAGSALAGDMVFDAQWDVSLGRTVKLNASLARSRGDVTVLAETAPGVSARVPAGVRDARLTLASQGEDVTLTLRWDSERAGVADGRLVTRLLPGGATGWRWPVTAPINGSLSARLPRIGVWSLLAPPGWRLQGSLAADLKAAGTRGDPQLTGTIAADDLALRSVVDGIELRNGKLRATLEGNRLRITEFSLRGAGERDGGGTVTATGEAAWVNGAPVLQARVQLARLRASIRSDRQLTLSGDLTARTDPAGSQVEGRLHIDQARIVLPEESEPQLGEDVVVRDAPKGAMTRAREREAEPTPAPTARPLAVAVDLELGDDFQVEGRGLQTRLKGSLALSGKTLTAPRLVGAITTVGGEYRAYNQRLDVERGVIRFTGRIDNPALDILAVRPNLTQRVGVLITGTAQVPYVRLYAEPDLPDAEKLAWLVTGRAAPSTGAESALVQQAALALLASRRPGSRGLAGSVGLDELSVRRDSSEGAVVTLGKRFARNFYASYERSLSGALGTLYIFYDVSRRLTVRAQAGERAGVDLIYTFSFN
ncbi:MAG: translocation/assembly module TamB domain-containing protein [Ramlibacter sp.]